MIEMEIKILQSQIEAEEEIAGYATSDNQELSKSNQANREELGRSRKTDSATSKALKEKA